MWLRAGVRAKETLSEGWTMAKALWIALSAVLLVGCMQADENPDWAPAQDLPGWAYDAPFYYRPSEELKPQETIGHGIPVYYSRSEYFFVRHPGGYQVSGDPRVCVWSSADSGEQWSKSGYFGVEQTHFLFRAEQDGPHWLRFVGPAQGVTEVPPGQPHRIYVVDRAPPKITLTVTPAPWKKDEHGRKVRHIYKTGETVLLEWYVADENLKEGTVKLGTCFAEFPHNLVWSRFPKALPPHGRMEVDIPPEAAADGGLRFRMEATDKADNVGMALTETMHVVAGDAAGRQPSVRPADAFVVTAGAEERYKDPRPGWPQVGGLLRGGTARVLAWMPEAARDYDVLEFQFSADNGLSWRTLDSGASFGTKIKWTVPSVTSKRCRIRIVGVGKGGERIMLALSQPFTVDTVTPDIILGPRTIPPEEQ